MAASVGSLASGSDQMAESISEIARGASDAAGVAGEAVGIVRDTNDAVVQLGASSAGIGEVIAITEIAEQTNLLALNATIEAARAGERGKGFAVVASEVKELAQETARATADITRRIAAIQSDTERAVQAIGRITEIVDRISDTQTTIASAVEEQHATTSEISRAVSEAASGTQGIAAAIIGAGGRHPGDQPSGSSRRSARGRRAGPHERRAAGRDRAASASDDSLGASQRASERPRPGCGPRHRLSAAARRRTPSRSGAVALGRPRSGTL